LDRDLQRDCNARAEVTLDEATESVREGPTGSRRGAETALPTREG